MRFRLLFLCLPVLLGACAKSTGPLRLDLIGNSTLTSGSKTVAANDTLRTRVYAESADALLKRLTISVTYNPGPGPILYPLPLSSYDPTKNAPPDLKITILDSLIVPASEYLFENRFSARSTTGTELWQYKVLNQAEENAARAYRLTVRKPDSAQVFHNFAVVMRPLVSILPTADGAQARDRSRVFLGLNYGLLLPRYAVLNNEATVLPNQQLVDVVCRVRDGSVVLDAPAYSTQPAPAPNPRWPQPRAPRLRRTSLSADDFTKALTAAAFATAFDNGTKFTDSLSTGPLAKPQVVAFKTTEGKAGLLLVNDLTTGTAPLLNCFVKVQK